MVVAIIGGSGSGKTWLAEKLEQELAPDAVRLSLDDFYADRSHLTPARRAQLNFDHPRAIDWASLDAVLSLLSAGGAAQVPVYDFKTHCRVEQKRPVRAMPIVLLDGLWLLRRPSIRRLISLSIFLECSTSTRLQRRIARDMISRGRTRASIRRQFLKSVEPMHARYVSPQIKRADIVLRKNCTPKEIRRLADKIRRFLSANHEKNPRA
jgi:uridine kinase